MHPVTPYPILDWFLWGFFMGFGWTLISFFLTKLLSKAFP